MSNKDAGGWVGLVSGLALSSWPASWLWSLVPDGAWYRTPSWLSLALLILYIGMVGCATGLQYGEWLDNKEALK